MDKSLGTLWRFCGPFSNSQRPNPYPYSLLPTLTPQTMLDAHIHNCFRVSTLYRLGGGRSARKFQKGCTVLRGNREMTEKYEYCSSYCPKDFCPGLSESWFWGKRLLSSFFLCFLGILETSSWSHAIIMTFETISSTYSKFLQGNSLISHIGPTPLNWSPVQRKLVRHDVSSIVHSTRSQKHSVLSIFATNSLRKHG